MSTYSWSQDYTLENAVADAKEIKVGEAEFGRIYVPNGASAATLNFYASPYSVEDAGNTAAYEECHDATAAITVAIAADESHQIPLSIMAGARFLKIISTVDNQAVQLSFSD